MTQDRLAPRRGDRPTALEAPAPGQQKAAERPGPPRAAADRAVRQSLAFLLTGEGIGYAGSSVHAVALPALAVLYLHAGPGQVALLACAAKLPVLIMALPAGVVIDRRPLRTVLIATDLTAAVVVSVIPLAAGLGHL